MQTVTETPFLRAWRQHPQLPIEAAYERYACGEITYAEYRRDHADPEEALRAARRREGASNARAALTGDAQEAKR